MLRGDIVKDDSGAYAVFTEQGSSASQMTAANVMENNFQTSRMLKTSSRCNISLYLGQNGRCINVVKNSKVSMCKSGTRRKTGAKCAVHKDENCFLLGSDLSSRRLCAEKYVTVMSTVSGCDVTTVQQHNTGSTSSMSRYLDTSTNAQMAQIMVQQARLLASRGCVRFARRPSLH